MTSSWTRFALAFCLVGLCAASAFADDAERALALGDEGTTLYQDGKYAEAAEKFLEAYKLSPNAPNFIYNAARAYHKLGNFDVARQYYELALKKGTTEDAWWTKAEEHLAAVKQELAKQAPKKPEATSEPVEPDLSVSPAEPEESPAGGLGGRDAPETTKKSRNWLLVAAGSAAVVGALLLDVVPDGASDKEFSGWDLLPVVGYAAGAGLVWRGAF